MLFLPTSFDWLHIILHPKQNIQMLKHILLIGKLSQGSSKSSALYVSLLDYWKARNAIHENFTAVCFVWVIVLTQQVGLFSSKNSKLRLPVNWEGSDCTIACHPFSEIGQHLLFLWAPYWNTVCPRIWRAMSIWSVDTWKISSFTTTRKD